ncbi:MAG: trigger factor [Rhizobacter sp.]|nr:trigger factor [Rhizobacter sp.]MBP6269372.1 trigger factor [Rhizobacter sp.]
MAVTVETLEKLERRITLTLSAETIQSEISNRLKKLSRTVKADGFRPGKVPMSVVAQRYGYSVQNEVMNDQIGQAFADAANEAKLRVAGAPRITEKEGAESGTMMFDAVFEVFPEVKIGSLEGVEVERYRTDITEAAIDRTIDILRKQRRTFAPRPAGEPAVETDRVTIDFEGKFDGVPFEGGTAQGFQFVIGEGQMLETFDLAVRGMKVGESKTFPLRFPDDYQNKEAAGKEADFLVTVNAIEVQQLPELTDMFARSLGILDGSMESLRKDVRSNLEREVKARVMTRNKGSVMEVLLKNSELDVPAALVDDEAKRLVESTIADMKQRGAKDMDKAQIPTKIFQPQAERRVRLGLVVSELVRANNLQAKPEQLQAYIEEMAQSYEKPSEVVSWYLGDKQRMADVEVVVVENNVAEFVMSRGKVIDKDVPFDELMAS